MAPYEADAQLAYLYKSKKIDVVFTEDSDLLAFGVKRVVFKRGTVGKFAKNYIYVEINLENKHKVKGIDFSQLNPDEFLALCIMSG